MTLSDHISACALSGTPIRVGLIGAGKFGSMFLSQVPSTEGLVVTGIADRDPSRARTACETVGWSSQRIAETEFFDNGIDLIESEIDIVIEATGNPLAGITHARRAFQAGLSVIMVNVEADALVGPLLAREAREAGVIYSMAYGDQPALVAEQIEWARACGFHVVAAGKGTKYLPGYHQITPETVWNHYGISADKAAEAGMNSQMFTSFMDGTKSALEMAAIANACNLGVPSDGLLFPPSDVDELPQVLRPKAEGGVLERSGLVEVVACERRDGSPISRDLRWGVYVVIEAPNPYTAACFDQYGIKTDDSGRYAALYRPSHMIGLELGFSVLKAALQQEPTGTARSFEGDVVACAKTNLETGRMLDGEGGFTAYGKLVPSGTSMDAGALPIGLAHQAELRHPVKAGEIIRWDDVSIDLSREDVQARLELEKYYSARQVTSA